MRTLGSLPENTAVKSQRITASTSMMGLLRHDSEEPEMKIIPRKMIANTESGPLASYAGMYCCLSLL